MTLVEASPERSGFQAGDIIAERYQLAAMVGEGGMGAVWRARHLQLDSEVALKLMSPAIAAQPDALSRFLREARAAARLSSLHVVKVFDYGVDGKTPFIVMELLAGESLRERLDRDGAQAPATTLWIMRHAARALSKAHAEGIVHRDLKPENLFIAAQEEELVKVLDFGVAKLAGAAPAAPSMNTRTGAVLGTPFYMSPEQARGIKALDHRSDLWSLAVICFECLTGRLPFDSEAFGDLVLKICTLPAPVPSSIASVPAGFDAWFARAVEREPEQRFQSADEMLSALEPILGGAEALAMAPLSGARSSSDQSRVLPAAGAQHPLGATQIGVTASHADTSIPKHGLGAIGWALSALLLLGLGLIGYWVSRPAGAPQTAAEPVAAPPPALTDESHVQAEQPSEQAPATVEPSPATPAPSASAAPAPPSATQEPHVAPVPSHAPARKAKPASAAEAGRERVKPARSPGAAPAASPGSSPKPAPDLFSYPD